MKSFFRVPKSLLVLFLSAIAIYISINFWLIKYNEIISHGYEIGVALSNLCLSIIAAYFFYVIVHQIKEDKENKRIFTFLFTRIDKLRDWTTINRIKKDHNIIFSFPPKEIEVCFFFKKIIDNKMELKMVDLKGDKKDWFDYLFYQKHYLNKTISEIFYLSSFLDSKMLILFGKIIDSGYIQWINKLPNLKKVTDEYEFFKSKYINEHLEFHQLLFDFQKELFFKGAEISGKNLISFTKKELEKIMKEGMESGLQHIINDIIDDVTKKMIEKRTKQ